MMYHIKQLLIVLLAITTPTIHTNGGTIETRTALELQLSDVFRRTMEHWRYSYNSLDGRKAGSACIHWEQIDQGFLDDGIFEAIGFSYSMAKEDGAIRVATQGCDKMARHYELSGCTCEVVLVDDKTQVEIPDSLITRLQIGQ